MVPQAADVKPLYRNTPRSQPAAAAEPGRQAWWGAKQGVWVSKSKHQKPSEQYPAGLTTQISRAVIFAFQNQAIKYGAAIESD
eukprot:6088081-Pyramimonas_sp.AAC.1